MKRHYELKIIMENKKPLLIFTHKISKKTVTKNNKAKTINHFYMTTFPKELTQFLEVKNRSIYFYEHKHKVYITSRPPQVEHQEIKIQQTQQISIPRKYFNPEHFLSVVFTLDLGSVDKCRNKCGLLSMELK